MQSQIGQAESTLQLVRRCLFETLYFLQKNSFFKKLYYFSHFVTFVDSVSLCLKVWFPWDVNVMTAVHAFTTWTSLPFHDFTELQGFYVFYSAAVFLVLGTVVNTVYISSRLHAHGTLQRTWIARLLRAQLGVVTVFSPVILRVFLIFLECDYFGRTDDNGETQEPSYVSNHWENVACFDQSHPSTVFLFVLSVLMILTLFLLVGYGGLMHVNNPQCYSVQTRAHSRLDIAVLYVNMVLSCLFYILRDRQFHIILAVSFLCLHTPLLCFNVVFQPYYKSFMNNFRVMLQSVVVWSGLCLFISVFLPYEQASGSTGVTILYLTLVLPVAAGGFILSNKFRLRAIQKAMDKYYVPSLDLNKEISAADDGPTDADAFDKINAEYHSDLIPSFLYALKAAYVEVGTRFLQENQSPEHIRAAERIFLEGMMQYPQSEYLRVQYLTFLITYRQNYNLAALRLEAFTAMNMDLDFLFSLVRLTKEIDKAKQESLYGREIVGLDSISFEEVKRMNKLALKHVARCKDLLLLLWKLLSHSVQDTNGPEDKFSPEQETKIAASLEQLHQSELAAERSFQFILHRCQNASSVYNSYASFYREVKYDRDSAKEMKARARAVSTSSSQDDESSQSSSTGLMKVSQQQQDLKNDLLRSRLVMELKVKLRSVSLLLFCVVLSILITYTVKNGAYVGTFLNINQAGARRSFSQYGMHHSRSMHLAAMKNDEASFLAAQTLLTNAMDDFDYLHEELAHNYLSTEPQQRDWLHNPAVEVWYAAPRGIRTELLTGFHVISEYLAMARICANSSMEHYQAFDHLNPRTFPEYFWIQQNSHNILRSLDLSSALYQFETLNFATDLKLLLVVLAASALVLEIIVVIGVFRTSVSHLFHAFHQSICQLKHIDAAAIWTLMDLLAQDDSDHEEEEVDTALDPRFNHPIPTPSPPPSGSRSPATQKSPRASLELASKTSTVRFKEQKVCGLGDIGDRLTEKLSEHPIQVVVSDLEAENAAPSSKFHVPCTDTERDASQSSHSYSLEENGASNDSGGEDDTTLETPGSVDSPRTRPVSSVPVSNGSGGDDETGSVHFADSPRLVDSLEPTVASPASLDSFSDNTADTNTLECRAAYHLRRNNLAAPLMDDTVSEIAKSSAFSRPEQARNDSAQASKSTALIGSDTNPLCNSPLYARRRSANKTLSVPDLAVDDNGSETGKSSASSRSEQLAELETLTSRSSRRRYVTIIYTACLIASVISLFTLVMLGVFSIQPGNSSSELNNSGRRRSFATRLGYLTRELVLSQTENNFLGGAITFMNDTDYIRCLLTYSSQAMLSVHYGLITGRDAGWVKLPESRGWVPITANTPCSSLVEDPELFELSQSTQGSFGDNKLQDECSFKSNCLTELPFDANAPVMVEERMSFFSKPFSRQKCVYFDGGDRTTSNGLHTFVELMVRAALNVAEAPEEELKSDNPDYVFYHRYSDSDEWNLGLSKSALIYQQMMLDTNKSNFEILVSICVFVIIIVFAQHSILEKRIEVLMQENLAMTFIIDRLVKRAGEVHV